MRVIENSPVILYVATFHVKLTPYNTMYQATGFYTCGNDNALTFLADIIIIIMLNKKKTLCWLQTYYIPTWNKNLLSLNMLNYATFRHLNHFAKVFFSHQDLLSANDATFHSFDHLIKSCWIYFIYPHHIMKKISRLETDIPLFVAYPRW